MSITVEAIYQDGVFRPLHPVTLPDNTYVEVNIPQDDSRSMEPVDLGALAGAFPELAVLGDEAVDRARDQWEHGPAGQIELLALDPDES